MSLLKVCVIAVVMSLAWGSAWGQTFQSLYSFPADGSTGRGPVATLTPGPDGNLYGTATAGGTADAGTAFRVSPLTEQFAVVGEFDGETTGHLPYSRLLNIGDGFLYGATEESSFTTSDHQGTVYRVDPNGGISQVFEIPNEILGRDSAVPTHPRALVSGEANTLQVLCADYPGLWRVPLAGGEPTIAYTFDVDSVDGGHARTIVRGSDGLLYGTTIGSSDAGDYPNGRGTIFRINPDGSGMEHLHEAMYESGTRPHGALVEAADGNFYGVMRAGGKGGSGCVFRISPSGNYTVLYNFGVVNNDLRAPYGDLLLASDGQLYGTTREGGAPGYGGVFRIKTNGSGYKVLHTFNYANGAYPEGGLVQAGDGNLYGTTTLGGNGDTGTIFRLKLNLPAPPVNRPPVAVNDVGVSTGGPVPIQVLANDYDPDNDALIVTIESAPTAGTAVVQSGGSILYTPGAGYDGADTFTYTVSDGRGGVSNTATVQIRSTVPGPLIEAGSYNGLLSYDPDLAGEGDVPRAQFLLTVAQSGQFTGVLFTQGKRVKLRGSFTSGGLAVVNIKLPKKRAAALFLGFQSGTPNGIVAVLFGPEIWSGIAGRVQSSGASAAEYFTILLEGNPATAEGHGFGIMRLLPNGLISAAGKLGDGSKLSVGTTLIVLPDASTAVPVFSQPIKGGVFGGFLVPEEGSTPTLTGSLRWMRPAASKPTKPYALGFNGPVDVLISLYVPAASVAEILQVPAGTVSVGDGPLPDTTSGAYSISGKKVSTESPLRALSFDRKTGLFGGKIQVGKKTIKFQGVVNQALNLGGGQFSIKGETGSVMLQAAENVSAR